MLPPLPAGIAANSSAAEAACLIAERIAALPRSGGPPLVCLNGAQGSGKSTMAALVVTALAERHGLRTALLSLDDFYLTHAERQALAARVHSLCATRGVPGTHDVALMRRAIAALSAAERDTPTPLPRFDKLADDRLPEGEWDSFSGRPDAILLEGWCVGLRSNDVPPWTGPINALEAEADPAGVWFAWSLAALARDYDPLWAQAALLVSLQVPDLETVIASRLKQEQGLAAASGRGGMDRAGVIRFVQHYERFTRALWQAMPSRADLFFTRDPGFTYTLKQG